MEELDDKLLEQAARERAEIVSKYDKGREEGAKIDPWEDPTFEVYHVTDRYGFIHDSRLPNQIDPEEAKQKAVEMERAKKWLKMLQNWDRYFPGEKVVRRIYKGIPDRLRGAVWANLLDLKTFQAEQQGVYEEMKERARKFSPDIRQIDLDVNRTYRDHIMFRERYGVKQQAMFHVLAAYSMYNTEVGYCQGMSQIAALLLMYLNEEDAFWAMSSLLSNPKHAMHGFFIPGFPKLLRFQQHHDQLIKKFLPKVYKQLDKQDIPCSLYTIKWFLQCFLDRIPFSLTLRIWDIYLLEGSKVLTAMAYNILKLHKRKLLKLQMEKLVEFLNQKLEEDFGFPESYVIEQLKLSMDELRKANMATPPKGDVNELPTKPFGLFVPPSVEQIIGRRTFETEQELLQTKHVSSGYRHSSLIDGGVNNRRMSQSKDAAMEDNTSNYDTATDGFSSHASIVDYHSSRTSFTIEGSEFGSVMGSANTTLTRPNHRNGQNNQIDHESDPRTPVKTPILSDGKTGGSLSQQSEYDNLPDSYYENDMERTLDAVARFTRDSFAVHSQDYSNGPNGMDHNYHMQPNYQFQFSKYANKQEPSSSHGSQAVYTTGMQVGNQNELLRETVINGYVPPEEKNTSLKQSPDKTPTTPISGLPWQL